MIQHRDTLNVEKRAWKEIRRNQPGRWAKVLKKAVPERYKELVRYARRS
jgi:hypothetical protein